MAAERTIRIRFAGSAKGLVAAAANAARAVGRSVDQMRDKANKAGAGLGDRLGQALSAVTTKIQGIASSPAISTAAGAIVAAMTPIIVAGIGSALLLGLGGGVLAAGIMTAVKDPAVAKAWQGFGTRAKKSLAGFTGAFKGPVTRAAKTFGDALQRMSPAFTRIGQTMAPIIDKLAPALASMAERAMPGIEKAIKASAPLFEKLAEHMPKLGDAISSFFDSISDSGPGALIFIDIMMTAIAAVLRFWGNGIEFWSNALEVLKTFFVEKIPAAWNWLVAKISAGVDAVSGFFAKIGRAVVGVRDWVVSGFNQVVSFIRGLPGRISSAAAGLFNGIKDAFRGAINWIIDKWNGLSFTLPSANVPGLGQVGGGRLDTPNLPRLATGGHARKGRSYLVGERGAEVFTPGASGVVTPNHALGGDTYVYVTIDGQQLEARIDRVVRERDRGLRRRVLAGTGAAR